MKLSVVLNQEPKRTTEDRSVKLLVARRAELQLLDAACRSVNAQLTNRRN